MEQSDKKTASQKIEKLLVRTLNKHFEKLAKTLNKQNRLSISDAKNKSPSPEPVYKFDVNRLSPKNTRKGNPPTTSRTSPL